MTKDEQINMLNRRIVSLTAYIDSKHEFLLQLCQKMESLGNAYSWRQVVSDLKSNIDAEFDFNLMKFHFEEVHPHFYKKLMTLNEALTHKDLRLCTFIKMRFSNKEIAFLLNISHDGIKKSIQRLRKKLALKPDESLRKLINGLD